MGRVGKSSSTGRNKKTNLQPSPTKNEFTVNAGGRQEFLELLGFSIDRSTDMIVFLTRDGRHVYANDAACCNLGYARDELLARNVRDIAPDFNDESWQCVWDVAKSRGNVSFQSRFKASDGRMIPVDITVYRFDCQGTEYLCGFSRDISERKRREEELKESRHRLSRAQEIARMGNWEYDLRTSEVVLSDEVYRIFGEAPGSPRVKFDDLFSTVHPDDREKVTKLFAESLSTKTPVLADVRIVRPDGTIAYVYFESDAPLCDDTGKPAKIFGIAQDITGRKLFENSLKQKFSELDAISKAMPDLYFRMTADGTIINYMAGTDSDLYTSPENFIGQRMQDVLPPDVGRMFDTVVREKLLSGSASVIEYTLPMPGGLRTYEARLIPLGEDQVFAIIRNITGLKSVEDALRQTRNRLLKAQQIAHLASWEWDVVRDEVSLITDAINDYFGPAALPDRSFHTILQLIHPQDRNNFAKIAIDTIANKEIFSLDHRILTREGELRYIHTEGEVVQDADRRPLKVIGIAQDITERKLIEDALRESEEKFRELSESSPFGILVTQNEKIVYVNQSVITVSGYSKEECLKMDYMNVIGPDYRGLVKRYATARLQGVNVPTRYEFSILAKNGQEKWIDCSPIIIRYNGQPAILMTLIDITDRKASETALKESKAEAELYLDLMGHDINNMNMIAMGSIEFALGRLQSKGGIEDADRLLLEKSIETLQGASRLIGNVRKLRKERMGEYKTKIVDLESVLHEVVADYSGVPGRDVTIGLSCAPRCLVQANELLKDVFLNLVGNAIKHSSGPLRIDVAVTRTSSASVDYYKVTIEDTGPGIPDDRKRWLMDRTSVPLPGGAGRGFGLRLVKSLVGDFHGIFRLEDRVPGDYARGSRFVVMLPAIEDTSR